MNQSEVLGSQLWSRDNFPITL